MLLRSGPCSLPLTSRSTPSPVFPCPQRRCRLPGLCLCRRLRSWAGAVALQPRRGWAEAKGWSPTGPLGGRLHCRSGGLPCPTFSPLAYTRGTLVPPTLSPSLTIWGSTPTGGRCSTLPTMHDVNGSCLVAEKRLAGRVPGPTAVGCAPTTNSSAGCCLDVYMSLRVRERCDLQGQAREVLAVDSTVALFQIMGDQCKLGCAAARLHSAGARIIKSAWMLMGGGLSPVGASEHKLTVVGGSSWQWMVTANTFFFNFGA